MAKAKAGKDHDDIFDQLKAAVVETAMGRHLWEDKAAEMLRVIKRSSGTGFKIQFQVIQLNTLEDRSVHDKQHWDGAIKFLSENVTEKLDGNENTLREMVSLRSLINCKKNTPVINLQDNHRVLGWPRLV